MEQLLLERFALSLCSNKLGLEADTTFQNLAVVVNLTTLNYFTFLRVVL